MKTERTEQEALIPAAPIIDTPGWRTLLKAALYFMAVTLPLAFYLRTYDSAMAKITLLQLGSLSAAAIWLTGVIVDGRLEVPTRSIPFLLPAALLAAWNAAGFAFSPYRLASLHGFLLQEIFLLTFILTLLVFSKADIRRAVLMVLGPCSVAVIYGILQYAGLDPFIWRGVFGDRVFSTLANPTLLAGYLLICVPLALSLASEEDEPLWLRAAAGALAIGGALLLQRTGDIIASLAFLPSLGAFALLVWRRRAGRNVFPALVLAAVCAAAAAVPFAGRAPAPANNRHYSFLAETWKGTAELIKSRPWTGSGPGSFWVRYPAFRRPAIFDIEGKHNNETDHPENELLEQWADGGLPGLLLWCWLFGGLLLKSFKALSGPAEARHAAGIFAAAAGSFLLMLAAVSARFPAPGWLIYFVAGLLAALAAESAPGEGTVLALPLPLRAGRHILLVPVFAAALLLAYGAVRAFQSDIDHNLAIFRAKTGQWSQAAMSFGKEAPWANTYIMSRYFLGNIFIDSDPGSPKEALEYYRQVRTLAPDYVQVHYRMGIALERLGRHKEAAESLERQVLLDPVWPEAWKKLAAVYGAAGDREKAEAAQRKAAELGMRAQER